MNEIDDQVRIDMGELGAAIGDRVLSSRWIDNPDEVDGHEEFLVGLERKLDALTDDRLRGNMGCASNKSKRPYDRLRERKDHHSKHTNYPIPSQRLTDRVPEHLIPYIGDRRGLIVRLTLVNKKQVYAAERDINAGRTDVFDYKFTKGTKRERQALLDVQKERTLSYGGVENKRVVLTREDALRAIEGVYQGYHNHTDFIFHPQAIRYKKHLKAAQVARECETIDGIADDISKGIIYDETKLVILSTKEAVLHALEYANNDVYFDTDKVEFESVYWTEGYVNELTTKVHEQMCEREGIVADNPNDSEETSRRDEKSDGIRSEGYKGMQTLRDCPADSSNGMDHLMVPEMQPHKQRLLRMRGGYHITLVWMNWWDFSRLNR